MLTGLALGAAGAAQADTATIKETTDYNTVHHFNTARSNRYSKNAMSFAFKSWSPGTGGYIVIGARNSAGTQFTDTGDMTTFKTYSMGGANPPGTFYLNTHIVGGCGGSGCGNQTFGGTLTYNINNS